MKKINCNIIRDILPLYLDDVVCDDTKELVEDHLNVCDSCRMEAEILGQNIALPTNRNIKLSDAKVVKKLKNRLFRKKVVVSVISVVVSVAIVIGIYAYMSLTSSYIPYDSANIRIEDDNGELYVSYDGDHLAGTVIVHTEVTIDGEEKDAVIFSYYETLWSRYVEPLFNQSQEESGICGLGDKSEIDRIYYAEFDLDAYLDYCSYSAPTKEWDTEYMIERSEMIWSE